MNDKKNTGYKENKRILIVSAHDNYTKILNKYLIDQDFEVLKCEEVSVENCLSLFEADCGMVLLDIAVLDSLKMLKEFNKCRPSVPIIMVSEEASADVIIKSMGLGAWDFIIDPVSNFTVLDLCINRMFARVRIIKTRVKQRADLEHEIERRTREVEESVDKLTQALYGTINVISSTVELRDSYTAGHQKRVAVLARAIAEGLLLSDHQIESVFVAGSVHDIGKISVPAEILSSPNQLGVDEFNLIKRHPKVGYDLLKIVEFPWPLAPIVHQHHEKLDGSGYPQGLYEEQIMIEAKILCVADIVEAMSSHRPYRPSLGIDAAIKEINSGCGLLYDSEVVSVCTNLFFNKGFTFDYLA